jgi:hypothetical protein
MNDLVKMTPFGAIQTSSSRAIGQLTGYSVVDMACRLVQEGRRKKKVGLGPYLLVLPSEARRYLGVPSATSIIELSSLDFGAYEVTVDGVIGAYFSDRLRGRQIGLVDLCNIVME